MAQTDSNALAVSMDPKKLGDKLKYRHISDEARNQIVTRFLVEGHKLIDISRELGINYSSAKTIIKVFREQKRIKKIQRSGRHLYLKRNPLNSNKGDYERIVKDIKCKFEIEKLEESVFEPQVGKKLKKTEKDFSQKACDARHLDDTAPSTPKSIQTKLEESSTLSSKIPEEMKRLISLSSSNLQNIPSFPNQSFQDYFVTPVSFLSQLYSSQTNSASSAVYNGGFRNFYFNNLPARQLPPPLLNLSLISFTDGRLGMFNRFF